MVPNHLVPRLLGALSILVICIDLTLGLWPFHSRQNSVAWVKSATGVQFGRYGTIQRPNPPEQPPGPSMAGSTGASIELWVQPDRWMGSATLVALRAKGGYPLARLRQSLIDLDVGVETRAVSKRDKASMLTVSDALAPSLRRHLPVFLTVTSGANGTSVYVNGTLASRTSSFSIPAATLAGSLILGDSPGQPDSFRGKIQGLALYTTELDSDRVMRHVQTWTATGRPELASSDQGLALYLFHEGSGAVIRDHLGGGGPLQIPVTYFVQDKLVLEPFWNEFDFSRSYWSGNLKNVIGFLPVGFCLCAYWVLRRPSLALPITVLSGTLLSLTIEVSQIFLPMRDSGTTDLFTNTFGTYLGVVLYREVYLPLSPHHPLLAQFAPPAGGDPAGASTESN